MEKLVGVLDYGPSDLADSFRAVRKDSIIIAEEIGEEHYSFSPATGTRTIAQLLTHIAAAPKLQQQFHRINQYDPLQAADFRGFLARFLAEQEAERSAPRTRAQILELLRLSGELFAQWLEGLSPDFLAERIAVEPGKRKTRFEAILRVKEHEIHHCGQLMLIERVIGLVPHTTRGKTSQAAATVRTSV
jgi:uncharacterized damage-inducible protein DinB